MSRVYSIGLIGARGHVGVELIRLIESHPDWQLDLAVSREWAGQRVCDALAGARSELIFEALNADDIAKRGCDLLFLALPNDKSAAIVEAVHLHAPNTIMIDLSADHRFDDTWAYGQPETKRETLAYAKRIANPGCYATAMQLALAPIKHNLRGAVSCFGVSGYSGAGTTPSDKNNPDKLQDNLMPYHLIGHIHEQEVSLHLGSPVEFMPHVAPHFRGITMTVNAHLNEAFGKSEITRRFHDYYHDEPLVRLREDAPWVSEIAGHHHAEIGGFTLDASGTRLVIVCTLDNLLKGAATQAVQNANLALGLPECRGIVHE